jgi:hypothetical protein
MTTPKSAQTAPDETALQHEYNARIRLKYERILNVNWRWCEGIYSDNEAMNKIAAIIGRPVT